MTSPIFSIVIPTRDRPLTFPHTLATVVAQGGDDFEIVVADNASGPEARIATEAITSCPVVYVRSETIIPMTDNWIRGIDACRGEYITVLGDDDALAPSALNIVRKILNYRKYKLIRWDMHSYWWPDTIVECNRNMLFVHHVSDVQILEYKNESLLQGFYKGANVFGELPMLYNSFVHRSILQETKKKWGSYLPIPHIPDVLSGILNLLMTEEHAYCQRSLGIRGNSGKSNGTSFFARSQGDKVRNQYFEQENAKLKEMIHPSLVPSPNLEILIASFKLKCRDLFFPGRPDLDVDIQAVITGIIKSLNNDVDAYDDNLSDAMALANKYNIKIDTTTIPVKGPSVKVAAPTGIVSSNGKVVYIGVDGNLAGINNIHQASRLAEAMLPRVM